MVLNFSVQFWRQRKPPIILIFHRESKDYDFEPAADAGGGQEVGEDAGDRPQPAQVGAKDEVSPSLDCFVL